MTKVKADLIIDASNLILGRMASHVAKKLLSGYTVAIVNAEKAVISGSPKSIISEYREAALSKRTWKRPMKGHKKVKRPDLIVKRVIRGMLPYKKPRGREAYKRLRVYLGLPKEYEGKSIATIPEASASKLSLGKYITVGELALNVGWRPTAEASS